MEKWMGKPAGRLLQVWDGSSRMIKIAITLLLALSIAGMIMLSG